MWLGDFQEIVMLYIKQIYFIKFESNKTINARKFY